MNTCKDYRENARKYFKESGLTYSDIKEKDFYMLLALLAEELENFSEKVKDPNIHGIASMRISDRNGLKRYLPIFNKNDNGGLKSAFIYVDSHYFSGREAISFNNDFVGFAGWADDTNIQPFTDAFIRFTDYLKAIVGPSKEKEVINFFYKRPGEQIIKLDRQYKTKRINNNDR